MAGQEDVKSTTNAKAASEPTSRGTAAKPGPKPKSAAKPAPAKSTASAPKASPPKKVAQAKPAPAKAEAAKPKAAAAKPKPAVKPKPPVVKSAQSAAEDVAKAGKDVAAASEKAATAVSAQAAKTAKDGLALTSSTVPDAVSSVPTSPAAYAGFFSNLILEDSTMDMNANLKDVMSDAQTKAKAAFEKGTEVFGEVTDFTKGNVEAVIESGKILAEGMQGMGSSMMTESRSAFESMSGDMKELAAAKSPTDFFKIQGDMMRKNFDSVVASGSKNSETMLKLMSDVMAPLSGRVSLAMEKARTAA